MARRGVNECTIMGTIGRDAELKEVNDSFSVIRLSLAVSEKWKDKSTGEDKEKTEWVPVEIHNRKGLAPHLTKGSRIMVRGQFTTRTYEKDGETRYASCVTVGAYGDVQFCGSTQQQGNQQSQQQNRQFSGQQPQQQQRQPQRQPQSNDLPMDFSDDIPFASAGLQYSRHAINALYP